MKMSNEVHADRFTTLDAYVAGFLTIKGFVPDLVQEGPRVVFSFPSSPKLLETLSQYNSGALVPAAQLALATKSLKSQIHSLKMNKGMANGYGLRFTR
jgi:hypothetical protein